MRFGFVLVCIVVMFCIVGCAPNGVAPERFDVTFTGASQNTFYDHENEKPMEILTFLMTNHESISLDCSVVINLDNSTDTSVKKARIGVLEPDVVKNVSITYEMLDGDTEIVVDTLCDKV